MNTNGLPPDIQRAQTWATLFLRALPLSANLLEALEATDLAMSLSVAESTPQTPICHQSAQDAPGMLPEPKTAPPPPLPLPEPPGASQSPPEASPVPALPQIRKRTRQLSKIKRRVKRAWQAAGDVDASFALQIAVGQKVQGRSGRWFTRLPSGRVVPTTPPGGTHPERRWPNPRALQSAQDAPGMLPEPKTAPPPPLPLPEPPGASQSPPEAVKPGPTEYEKRKAREQAQLQEKLKEQPKVVSWTYSQEWGVADINKEMARVFGGPPESAPKMAQIAALVGAQGGSTVVTHLPAAGGLVFRLEHPYVTDCQRTLKRAKDGSLVMENDMFFLRRKYRGGGFGLSQFSEQVKQCAVWGVDRIETCAGKGGGMNGYYTWAVLGYDAPLESYSSGTFYQRLSGGLVKMLTQPFERKKPDGSTSTRPAMSEEEAKATADQLKDATTVQDLMAHPAGREYWLRYGFMTHMEFNLDPDSRNMKVLNGYLKSKGKPPIEIPSDRVAEIRQQKVQRQEEARQMAEQERRNKEEAQRREQEAVVNVRQEALGRARGMGLDEGQVSLRAQRAYAETLGGFEGRPLSQGERWGSAFRLATYELGLGRHHHRMDSPEPAWVAVHEHFMKEAEQQGFDPLAVRNSARNIPVPLPDAVNAISDAYREAIRLYQQGAERARSGEV